jgi:MSHA biogenesis protein MshI
MPAWLTGKRDAASAWLAFAVHDDRVDVALVERSADGRAAVRMCDTHATRGAQADTLKRLRGSLKASRYGCTTLLSPGQYQLQLLEAPAVPATELRQAVRWKLKDLLDYPVDAATVDVVNVPPSPSAGGRAQFVYAVSARNDQVGERIRLFHSAKVPLQVIDVPEMAQRNVARLFEEPNRGLALLAFDRRGGMLTFTAGGELYMSRYTDITLDQLASASSEVREQALERLVLELQRSIDHFDRQFSYVTLARLLVAPVPVDGLVAYLADNLYVPVQTFDLAQVMDVSAAPALRDPVRQSESLHLLGAALRSEAAAA